MSADTKKSDNTIYLPKIDTSSFGHCPNYSIPCTHLGNFFFISVSNKISYLRCLKLSEDNNFDKNKLVLGQYLCEIGPKQFGQGVTSIWTTPKMISVYFKHDIRRHFFCFENEKVSFKNFIVDTVMICMVHKKYSLIHFFDHGNCIYITFASFWRK